MRAIKNLFIRISVIPMVPIMCIWIIVGFILMGRNTVNDLDDLMDWYMDKLTQE